MRIRVPPRKIREGFRLIYELHGAKKAVDYLSKYYGVKQMRLILDGKRVGRGYSGVYIKNRAYFTKRGLTKRIILHEFYHHLIEAKGLEMPIRKEEKEANRYARAFFNSTY